MVSYYDKGTAFFLDNFNYSGIDLPKRFHLYHVIGMAIGVQAFLEICDLIEIA